MRWNTGECGDNLYRHNSNSQVHQSRRLWFSYAVFSAMRHTYILARETSTRTAYEGRAVARYRAESERQPRISSQRTLPASRLESDRLQTPRPPLGTWIGRTAKQGLFLVEILSLPAVQALASP